MNIFMKQFIYKYEYRALSVLKKAIKNGAKFLQNYVIIAVIKTFKNAPQLIAIFPFSRLIQLQEAYPLPIKLWIMKLKPAIP